MRYYYLEPEAVSETGDLTSFDRTFFPPKIDRLHWMIDCWNGDVLVELFWCFIVTESVMKQIELHGLSGTAFDRVKITTSEQYNEFSLRSQLPNFFWMKVIGDQAKADFGICKPAANYGPEMPIDPKRLTLVVSQRALDLLQYLGIPHATVEEFCGIAGKD